MSLPDYEDEAFRRMLDDGLLPRPHTDDDDRALRTAGVRLRGHGLLREATLPAGWRAVQDEPRWGSLIDDQDRVRGRIHYKWGPMEANGFIQMNRRYTTFSGRSDNSDWCAWDSATGTVLFEPAATDYNDQYARVEQWLDDHFSKWKDPTCYWRADATILPHGSAPRRWWSFRR